MVEQLRLHDIRQQTPTYGSIPVSPAITQVPLPNHYIHGFFETVNQAYELAKKTDSPPDGTWFKLVEDYPKDRQGKFDTAFNVVQWSVEDSMPAGMSRDGYDAVPTRPLVRVIQPSGDKTGYSSTTTAWQEWVTVCFTAYAKTNRGAREIAEWFHLFLIRWAQTFDFFRMRGIQKFQFVRRGKDEETNKYGDNPLYLRPLLYKFRIEVQDQFETKTLDTLNLTVNGIPAGTLTDPRS